MNRAIWIAAAALLLVGCSDDDAAAPAPTTSLFDISSDLSTEARFLDHPYPSDLRLSDQGTPDLSGFINPGDNPLLTGLLEIAAERPGFPVVPVAYFRFSAELAAHDPNDVVLPSADAPALLIDVDDTSPNYGTALPVVLANLPALPAPCAARCCC